MLFTPLWFWALRREIESFAVGATVAGGRLAYPAFRLSLSRQGETRDLVFWLDSAYARAEWADLRDLSDLPGAWATLGGSICRSVEQPDTDRRLRLALDSERGQLTLDFFAYGKSGLILMGTGTQVDPIALIGRIPGEAPVPDRPLVSDLTSDTPPPAKPCPDLTTWLHDAVRGLDDIWIAAAMAASDVAPDAPDVSEAESNAAWQFICNRGQALRHQPLQSFVVKDSDTVLRTSLVDFSLQLPHLTFTPSESLSAASGRTVYYLRREQAQTNDFDRLMTIARGKRGRIKRRLGRLQEDARQQQDHAIWQENADCLTAQLGQIQKGEANLEVHTADGTRTVELDPAIPPSRQAKRWYHKARRLRRGLDITRKQLETTQAELSTLEDAIAAAQAEVPSESPTDSHVWRKLRELVGDTDSGKRADKSAPRLPFRRYRSPGGLAIWVGRNNKENDELTLHQAHKKDLWFHAQQTPGSHVVLRSHALSQTPAKADILAAAAVAAFYSKARHSSKVPVIYTEARYVRKARKAPPGQVLVEREKSVMVLPEKPPEWNESDNS